MQAPTTVEQAQALYRTRQKKKPRERGFSPRALPSAASGLLRPGKATIRVVKKYGRFNKVAKSEGWLYSPPLRKGEELYDVTSGGSMHQLSPMILGPVVDKHGDVLGLNIEDAWQGRKVWRMHMRKGARFDAKERKLLWREPEAGSGKGGALNRTHYSNIDGDDEKHWMPEWKRWSEHICFSGEAKRHRGPPPSSSPTDDTSINNNPNVPLMSCYRGMHLSYVEARKCMYIPWYAQLCRDTEAFRYLKSRFDAGVSLVLLEPDGDSRALPSEPVTRESLQERIDDPERVFGHAYVLASALMGLDDVWGQCPCPQCGSDNGGTNDKEEEKTAAV